MRAKSSIPSLTFVVTLGASTCAWEGAPLSVVAASLEAAETCGNEVCDAGETKQSCPQDCRRLFKLLRQRRERSASAGRPSASEAATLGPGDSLGSLAIEGRERTYVLHRPSGYSPAKRYPLVLVFHGGHGTGAKVAKQTGFSDYADREGFLVGYPDGVEHNWNDGRGTTDAERLGVDDVKFVRALIEELARTFPIDPARIYATGVSNGGIFTHRLGCELADVLAAIGPAIGPIASNMASQCRPLMPIAVVAIQGTADPFIPVEGGEEGWQSHLGSGGFVESAEATIALWAGKNGCAETPTREAMPVLVDDGTHVERVACASCRAGTDVVLYLVNGMGHIWPPKDPRSPRISGATSGNLDATRVIWDFFKEHPKQRPPG